MTVFIQRAGSGHLQRHIWKLDAVLYEATFAVDKIGQDYQSVSETSDSYSTEASRTPTINTHPDITGEATAD